MKIFTVWVEVEETDETNDQINDRVGDPFKLAQFDNQEKALEFAGDLAVKCWGNLNSNSSCPNCKETVKECGCYKE